jgi:hypothetical protein
MAIGIKTQEERVIDRTNSNEKHAVAVTISGIMLNDLHASFI